jgi:uncharacterized protein with HEPN domain
MTEQFREVEYLQPMLQAVSRIRRYSGGSAEGAFLRDEMLLDAIICNFEIVGEAANRISPEFARLGPTPTSPFQGTSPTRQKLAWRGRPFAVSSR